MPGRGLPMSLNFNSSVRRLHNRARERGRVMRARGEERTEEGAWVESEPNKKGTTSRCPIRRRRRHVSPEQQGPGPRAFNDFPALLEIHDVLNDC